MDSSKQENVYKVSAPGKVILHGEHSVVYGKTALAISLGMRTTAAIKENLKNNDTYIFITLANLKLNKLKVDYTHMKNKLFTKLITFPCNWFESYKIDHDNILGHIIDYWENIKGNYDFSITDSQSQSLLMIIYMLCIFSGNTEYVFQSFDLTVETQLKIGCGIGSSASFAVAIVAVMLNYLRFKLKDKYCYYLNQYSEEQFDEIDVEVFNEVEKKLISNWAYHCEKISHGNPSGIDNAVCTFGSLIEFKKGMEPVNHKLKLNLKVCLVNTNVNRNTKNLVNKVSELNKKYPEIINSLMESLNYIAEKALQVIQNIDTTKDVNFNEVHYRQLEDLFDINHNILRTLNVSHPLLEKIVSVSKDNGFSCKLTGAGGGGFAIILIPPYKTDTDLTALVGELHKNNLETCITNLGGDGVLIENY